jgi:drug/metabolite transporter (DMT)-like permease
MIAILLAALSGVVWGTGDFAGGKATQRTSSLVSTVFSKAASVPLLLVYLAVLRMPLRPATLGWGALAGLFGMVGMIVFYRALSTGAMSVVAPVSAVTSALVPLAVGLVIERSPGAQALVGVGCAVAAIALVSMAPRVEGSVVTLRLIGLALVAGLGFGLFFVCLSRAGAAAGGHAGLWPILAAHTAALTFGGILLLRGRSGGGRPAVPIKVGSRATWIWIVIAGVFDMTANVLYLLAVQGGLLSIVAPIASLYPASTVLLAMLVDRERMRPIQLAGLGLAATALVLVAS